MEQQRSALRQLPNIYGFVWLPRWPSQSPPHDSAIYREPAGPRFGLIALEEDFLAGGQCFQLRPHQGFIAEAKALSVQNLGYRGLYFLKLGGRTLDCQIKTPRVELCYLHYRTGFLWLFMFLHAIYSVYAG